MKSLTITAKIQVQKTPAEVFDAIIDPAKMSNYFIARGSGKMESGKEVKWSWPEFDGEFSINVNNVQPKERVAFSWEMDGRDLQVEITLEPRENGSTLVTVTEKEMPNNDAGIKWLGQNSEGWANFLACLKAYLEYGINLRKGAFDFMKK